MAIKKSIGLGSVSLFIYVCVIGGGLSYILFRAQLVSNYPVAFAVISILLGAMILFTGLTVFTTFFSED